MHIFLGFSFATCPQSQLGSQNNDLQKPTVFQESFEPPGEGEPKDTSGAGSRKGLRCSQNEQPIEGLMRWQRICNQKFTAVEFNSNIDNSNG